MVLYLCSGDFGGLHWHNFTLRKNQRNVGMMRFAVVLDLLLESSGSSLQDPLRVQPFLSKVFEAAAPGSGTDSMGPRTFSKSPGDEEADVHGPACRHPNALQGRRNHRFCSGLSLLPAGWIGYWSLMMTVTCST